MKTLSDYIDYFKLMMSQGDVSDDFRWSEEAIYALLRNIRAQLLIQKSNKNRKISDFTYQNIPCFNVSYTTFDNCDCVPTDQQCKYLKTDDPIPELLQTRHGYLGYVTDAKGNIIDFLPYRDVQKTSFTFLKKDIPLAFIRDGHVYVTKSVDLDHINIYGVFYDPLKVAEYDCGTEVVCYNPLTQAFPVDKELSDTLLKMSYEELMKYSMQVPQDVVNNASTKQ
jgi:hypothetical protein